MRGILAEKEAGATRLPFVLAERAASEGPRSTRAVEDQPGHPLEGQRASLEGTFTKWNHSSTMPTNYHVGRYNCLALNG
jgi:hypothetical protein